MASLPENSDTDNLPFQFSANTEVSTSPRFLIVSYFLAVTIAATLQALWFDELIQLIGDTAVAAPALAAAFIAAQLTGYFLLVLAPKLRGAEAPLLPLLLFTLALSALATPLFLEVFDYLHVTIFGSKDTLPSAPGLSAALFYFLAGYGVTLAPLACAGASLAVYQNARRHDTGLVETGIGLAIGYLLGWHLTRDHSGFTRELWVISSLSLILCGVMLASRSRRDQATMNIHVIPRAAGTPAFLILLPLFLSAVGLAVLYRTVVDMLVAQQGYLRHAPAICIALLCCGIGIGGWIHTRFHVSALNKQVTMGFAYSLTVFIGAILILFTGSPADTAVASQGFLITMYLLLLTIAVCNGAALQHALTDTPIPANRSTIRMGITLLPWLGGFPVGMLIAGLFLAKGAAVFWTLATGVCLYILAAVFSLHRSPSAATRLGCLLIMLAAGVITLFTNNKQNRSTTGTDATAITQFLGADAAASVHIWRGPANDVLLINGLAEATIGHPMGPPQNDPQRWLTALPFALLPTADNLLLVGGAGMAPPEDLPPLPGYVDVIEPSAQVMQAYGRIHGNQTFLRGWHTPKVNYHMNDIVNVLTLTERRYDIIVTSPQSPARRRAEQLESRDYLRHINRHLERDGIYIHGVIADYAPTDRLRRLIERLLSRFEDVQLFQTTPGMFYLVASDTTIDPRIRKLTEDYSLLGQIEYFSRSGINAAEDLLLSWRMNRAELAAFVENTETALPDSADRLSAIPTEQNRIYIASRLLALGFPNRMTDLRRQTQDKPTALVISALESEHSGRPDTAERLLMEARTLAPQDQIAGYLLVRNYLDDLAIGSAPAEIGVIASELRGPPENIARIWTNFLGNDWYGILPFERELARVEPLEPWYAEAALLRATWRINYDSSDYRRAMLIEAIRIIDRALASYYSGKLYLARARAANLLGQSSAAIETARTAAGLYELQLQYATREQEPKLLRRLLSARTEAAQMQAVIRAAGTSRDSQAEAQHIDRRYAGILERMDTEIDRLRLASNQQR
jgi:hypothetical protein